MSRSEPKKGRGGNAIEFGLVMPWLVLVLAAVIDYSFFMFEKATVLQAVREGARTGSVANIDTDIGDDPKAMCETAANAILNNVRIIGTTADCTYTATVDTDPSNPNPDTIEAHVDHTFQPLFNYSVLPLPSTIDEKVTLEVESSW